MQNHHSSKFLGAAALIASMLTRPWSFYTCFIKICLKEGVILAFRYQYVLPKILDVLYRKFAQYSMVQNQHTLISICAKSSFLKIFGCSCTHCTNVNMALIILYMFYQNQSKRGCYSYFQILICITKNLRTKIQIIFMH